MQRWDPSSFRAEADGRLRSRELDISESHYLLMEMVTQEPVIQYCFKAIQGTCLSQGILLKKKGVHDQDPVTHRWSSDATSAFQEHINTHFIPFCEEAIRMFYICGFVPWILRRCGTEVVPEVLPLGTFTWTTELLSHTQKRKAKKNEEEERRQRRKRDDISSYIPRQVRDPKDPNKIGVLNPGLSVAQRRRLLLEEEDDDDDPAIRQRSDGGRRQRLGHAGGTQAVRRRAEGKYVSYQVNVVDGGLDEEDVFIYDFAPAKHGVCSYSVLYSTVESPLANLIIDYKNLRQGQIRRSHADAWNTQAKLVTTVRRKAPPPTAPGAGDMAYGRGETVNNTPQAMSLERRDVQVSMQHEHGMIADMVLQQPNRSHVPVVYTLPSETDAVAMPDLKPAEDISLLLEKYTRDVALVMGIPPHFVVSKTNLMSSTSSSSQVETLHQFMNNMQTTCKHLERLLSDVHEAIYGSPAQFNIVAQPRVAIESVQDIKSLVEAGLLLPHKGSEIVDMLLLGQNLPTGGPEAASHAKKVFTKMHLSNDGAKKG